MTNPTCRRALKLIQLLSLATVLALALAAPSGELRADDDARSARGHGARGSDTHDHGPAPGRVMSGTQRAPLAELRAELHRMRELAPPPPPGVTDLDFGEVFDPIGDRGPTYSAKLQRLAGKPVRMIGYMVRQDAPVPGMLLLAPFPFQLHESEYGLAEDLPATLVHVLVPERKHELVPFTPGLLLLTGDLAIGPREEPDGRISNIRLHLHHPATAAAVAIPKERNQ